MGKRGQPREELVDPHLISSLVGTHQNLEQRQGRGYGTTARPRDPLEEGVRELYVRRGALEVIDERACVKGNKARLVEARGEPPGLYHDSRSPRR